jgi:16S rRNA (guanine966-N2)-methyltransferase
LFEAVSRGANNAFGVEMERKLADAINTQAEKFGVSDKLKCLCQDVFTAIPGFKGKLCLFDVIMIAPPQYQGLIDKTLLCLREFPVLTKGGIILCQHDTSEKNKIDFAGFQIKEERKYGNTTFTILG